NAHAKAIGQMSEDRFLKRMSEEAQQRGWSLENAVDRNRLITILRASEPEAVPLLGSALVEAQRLGGTAQYWHLREVAKKLSLQLDRANDRAFAERQMYAERGRTLQTAEVYEEAAAAVIRREGLNFAEAKAKRRAAEIVFAARPDLVSIYGSGAKKPQAEPTPPTPDVAGAELIRLVETECASRGLDPLSDGDRHEAVRRILKKHPRLAPNYGSRGNA